MKKKKKKKKKKKEEEKKKKKKKEEEEEEEEEEKKENHTNKEPAVGTFRTFRTCQLSSTTLCHTHTHKPSHPTECICQCTIADTG